MLRGANETEFEIAQEEDHRYETYLFELEAV